ncbi:CA [Lepeophtheirus salmonis]|uniref:Carbonic anhydrase n=1 Tax=Lepeophtheirus salmonis TaxID=72036 RepID=A0A7R8CIF6_LEPSM|nr:CA [Lepeophtheirus salmonis]CAF2831112.1 CA [Lepeophtheirus salmonis]
MQFRNEAITNQSSGELNRSGKSHEMNEGKNIPTYAYFINQKPGRPITFKNYEVAHSFSMKNTGKTAKLTLKNCSINVPTITSSHLSNDTNKFAQLHFHWGDMDKYGSEHIIDGFQYPIEAHLVHFNTKYGATIEEALSVANKSDNLAVLGVFFDIIPCTITDLDPLIYKLKNIQSEGTKVDVKGLALEKLLPTDLNTFFSYEGSLTTPRCNEVVAWTVFKASFFFKMIF